MFRGNPVQWFQGVSKCQGGHFPVFQNVQMLESRKSIFCSKFIKFEIPQAKIEGAKNSNNSKSVDNFDPLFQNSRNVGLCFEKQMIQNILIILEGEKQNPKK